MGGGGVGSDGGGSIPDLSIRVRHGRADAGERGPGAAAQAVRAVDHAAVGSSTGQVWRREIRVGFGINIGVDGELSTLTGPGMKVEDFGAARAARRIAT
jgi:hypothetical protein